MEKDKEELLKKMENMTSEEKKSSLLAPFWDENAEVDTNTPFMKEIEKIWNK